MFLISGGFALLAALGAGRGPQGLTGALRSLLGNAAGGALLWIVAVGLACFASWRAARDAYGESLRLTRQYIRDDRGGVTVPYLRDLLLERDQCLFETAPLSVVCHS